MKKIAALDLSLIGAGVGGRFSNTNKLKAMNYKQAMKSSNAKAWETDIEKEITNTMHFLQFLIPWYPRMPRS